MPFRVCSGAYSADLVDVFFSLMVCVVRQTGPCGNLLTVNSPRGCALYRSTAKLHCQATSLLNTPTVKMLGNNFTGAGTIKISQGNHLPPIYRGILLRYTSLLRFHLFDQFSVEEVEIGGNHFGSVRLDFGDIGNGDVRLRNNRMQRGGLSLNGSTQLCNGAGSGENAGCSNRAASSKLS